MLRIIENIKSLLLVGVIFSSILGVSGFEDAFAEPLTLFHTSFVDSFSIKAQDTFPTGLAFSSDGTKMFVVGEVGDDVNEYTLSTPFDVSTASFVVSFSVSDQDAIPTGVAFSSDGTKMFVVGAQGFDINEYTLVSAFDVSTASFVDSFSVLAQETIPTGVAFSSDGTKMFVVGSGVGNVNEYTLVSAFDVSTADFAVSFSVFAEANTPSDVAFSSDGTKMFVVGSSGDDVSEYTLVSAFDVSTASFVGSFSVAGQDTSPFSVAFSSDGAKMFVLGREGDDVNEYTLTTPFTLFHTTFVDSFSVAGQEIFPSDVTFSSDGTKMFVLGLEGDDVNEYTLATPFDVSTADFAVSFSVADQDTFPTGLAFSSDGTKMFVAGNEGDDINEYTLSTPFDVSTADFAVSFSVAGEDTIPSDVTFSSDGAKMFVVGFDGSDINEYTLTTPFDVSTADFAVSFSVAAQETTPQGVAFRSDGIKMFVVGNDGDNVNQYTLTTPFDVSTASFVDSFSVAGQDTNPKDIAFSSDGTKMFVVGDTGDDISEYTLASGFTLFHTTFVDSFSVAAQENNPTALAFSSDGTKMFVVFSSGQDVYEYILSTPFDVTTSSFVDSFSTFAQDDSLEDLAFSPDGTKMFVVGTAGNPDVNGYTLTTGFDVSTAAFVDSFDVSGEGNGVRGLAFSSDGTKMFVLFTTGDDKIVEYTLSTPFDVTTSSFVDSFSVSAQGTTPWDFAFSSDGIKMFVVGRDVDDVDEYTLSTGFDVSTAAFVDSFGIGAQEPTPSGLAFSSDGSKMFVVGFAEDNVDEYNITSIEPCSPPPSGNWMVDSSCTMTGDATAAGNVIVPNGVVLTIPNGITLIIPSGSNITILSGGGLLIEFGGIIIVVS